MIQKYMRDESKPASDDIAVREFAIVDREIRLKFHYGKGNVTASTRTFIKPPISEMGEGMVFKPELTFGYQAEVGAKPPRQLNLFILFEEQLKEEEKALNSIRDVEIQISEFLLLRAHEMAFNKLDISLFNKEQNVDFRSGMLEKEEQHRACKEKEVEEETDYFAPYLAKLGYPEKLTYDQALDCKYACLNDFKNMLVERANYIQKTFEKSTEKLQNMKNYYTMYHENLTPEEEAQYFEEVNNMITYLRTLEIRLTRHKDLSPLRYEALLTYLNDHPMLTNLY
nr:dynein regulatory complex subunit 7-like [Leptinotarsa decemlineata]